MSAQSALISSRVHARYWWERPALMLALVVLSTVPLLYPAVPPLVDLLGHIGRYRVELNHSAWLDRYYGIRWAAIGNLGVDVLVIATAPLIGVEPAVKVIVIAIPALTVAGFLWVAREVHGRIPPTAMFAVPFALGYPFQFGFVNFALSMALAFLAFALWLRLGRLGRTRVRAIVFVPISLVLFFCHTYGWGVLGLLCFSAEAVRLHDRGSSWIKAGCKAALAATVMALPAIIILVWRTGASGGSTSDWFNWDSKWRWITMALRDRWQFWDQGALVLIAAMLVFAAFSRKLAFSRNLAFSLIVLSAGFALLPRIVFGSAYADMRLVPYLFAIALLAIRFRGVMASPRLGQSLAVLAVLFCVMRLGGNTLSLAIAANDQSAKLEALDTVPLGARIITFVNLACGKVWALPRDSHIGAMVIVRRQGFSNDQWLMDGLNLLELKYKKPGFFAADPSQIVRPDRCPDPLHLTVDRALGTFPRDDFDYLWLVDIPQFDHRLVAGLEPVWRNPPSVLYRLHP